MRSTPVDDWHEVICKLGRLGIPFVVRNGGAHIKCRTVNYYPTTGRVQIDNARAFNQTGFDFLLEVLVDEGIHKL